MTTNNPDTSSATKPRKAQRPDDRDKVLKDMRRELVAGDDDNVVTYALELAEFARNNHLVHGVFPRLSTNNRLLLEAQRRKLGESWKWLFAGVEQWRKMGRSVRPGATAKVIWLPRLKNDPDAPDTKKFAGFVSRAVYYDYTDTQSDDPNFVEPAWDTPLLVGDENGLNELALVNNVRIAYGDISALNAPFSIDGSTIMLEETASIGNRLMSLAQALAAVELKHDERRRHGESEDTLDCEAALTAMIAVKLLGFDDPDDSITKAAGRYLRRWDDADGTPIAGHKRRIQLLDERVDTAIETAWLLVAPLLA